MIDTKKIMETMKTKKIRKDQLLILLLVGILLLVIAIPVDEDEKGKTQSTSEQELLSEGEDSGSDSLYISYIEGQLEEILSQMEGVGAVRVMVTLKESSEKVLEKDVRTSSESVRETDSQGGERTTTSQNLEEDTIYSDGEEDSEFSGSDTSGQHPYVSKELAPKIEGVVVVAEGGDNAVVVQNITESVQALFGIDTHKIRIVKKNQS